MQTTFLQKTMTLLALTLCLTTAVQAQTKIGAPGAPDPSAVLELSSTTRGFLAPRMTTSDRNAIANPAQGLIIYNIEIECIQYYDATKAVWQSLCGEASTTSEFAPNCAATSVQGTYLTGVELDASNTVTLVVDVTTLGTYAISATVSGMTFSNFGTFTTLGVQNLVLQGQGFPSQVGSNFLAIVMSDVICTTVIQVGNGIADISSCGSLGALSGSVGAFTAGVPLVDGDVTAPLTGITYTGGSVYGFNTSPNNGIQISAPLSGSLGTSPAALDLQFSGTPTAPGSTILSYSINDQTGCTITVPVQSGTGRASAVACTGALSGTYALGTAMTGSNTKVISATVSTIGTFNVVTTSTVNGVSFATAGTYTAVATGAQNITLVASGTPTSPGTFAYTVTLSMAPTTFVTCTFNVTYTIPMTFPNYTAINCATPGVAYTYVKASNAGASDLFGGDGYGGVRDAYPMAATKMSADGLTMVVGAYAEDGSGVGINPANNNGTGDAGAVYVFIRANTASLWTQQAYIKASNTGGADYFGMAVDISDDGNTIIVGALGEAGSGTGVNPATNEGANDAGAAYVFSRSGVTWTQQAYLKSPNPGVSDWFGMAVAVSGNGNTVAVGAYREDGSGTGINPVHNNATTDAGAVYTFIRLAGVWSFQATIKPSATGVSDWFGHAVALSEDGNTLAVGSQLEDGNGTGVNPVNNNSAANAGGAYVFFRTGVTWAQQAYIKASNTGANDRFGFSVDLSGTGNTLVVSAFAEDGSGSNVNPPTSEGAGDSGAAYVYTRSGSTWSSQAYIKAPNTGASDYFGWAISISKDGNSVMVGAPLEDGNVTCVNAADNNSAGSAGAVYQYFFNGGIWNFATKFKSGNIDANDWFGHALSQNSDGKSVSIGAGGEDGSGVGINPATNNGASAAGAVYVFTGN